MKMKLLKKAGMGATLCAALLTTVIPVHAEDKSVTISVDVGSTYTLSIPENKSINFNNEVQSIGAVKVSGNVVAAKTVTVNVETSKFTRLDDPTVAPFEFGLYQDASAAKAFGREEWSSTHINNGDKAINLYVQIPDTELNKAKAGSYNTTITFKATIN